MSCARIPLLSGDLPFEFVDWSSQLFCRDLWDSRHLIGVVVMHTDAALIVILTDFLFSFFLFIVVEKICVEFPKDIGNLISRRDDFTFLVLYLGDEHSFLCKFDSLDVLYTFQVFKQFFGCLAVFSFFFLSLILLFSICLLLSGAVSLLWVCFFTPR